MRYVPMLEKRSAHHKRSVRMPIGRQHDQAGVGAAFMRLACMSSRQWSNHSLQVVVNIHAQSFTHNIKIACSSHWVNDLLRTRKNLSAVSRRVMSSAWGTRKPQMWKCAARSESCGTDRFAIKALGGSSTFRLAVTRIASTNIRSATNSIR